MLAVAAMVALVLSVAGLVTLFGAGGPAEPSPRRDLGPPVDLVDDIDGDRIVLGDPETSGLDEWPAQFDVAPLAYDLDGDGTDELVAQSNDTMVYVFSADGRVLARLPTTYPDDWHIERIQNAAAAGVLRPGERPSLVVTDHAAYVTLWQVRASGRGHIDFERVWESRMDACFGWPGMDAKPTLADLDGDGSLEILVQTEEVGFFALRADGTELWHQCWAGGNSSPVAADVDGDGRLEVVVGSDAGQLSVLAGDTGQPIWTFNAAAHVRPASISVEPTVADLDGDGESEILFTVRDVPDADPDTWARAHMAIFAVHRNLHTWQPELVWMRQPEWANPLSYTRLVVQDVDGDGAMDIFGMDWNTVGHEPGHWEMLGPAHAFRLDEDGNDVWVRELGTWWSNKDVAIADTDGDGRLEMLANAPAPSGDDSLVALDVETGDTVRHIALPGWLVMRGPIMTDLRHDGTMQVVVPVMPTGGPPRGAFLLFELDVPYLAPWRGTP